LTIKIQVQVHQWKNRALRSRKWKRGNPTNYGVKVEWVRESERENEAFAMT